MLVADDVDERALRTQRLGAIESTFEALPITAEIAREWGRLAAAVLTRGGQSRRRAIDLAIAATANAHGVPLLTHNGGDFQIISDLTDARSPSAAQQTTDAPPTERPAGKLDHCGATAAAPVDPRRAGATLKAQGPLKTETAEHAGSS